MPAVTLNRLERWTREMRREGCVDINLTDRDLEEALGTYSTHLVRAAHGALEQLAKPEIGGVMPLVHNKELIKVATRQGHDARAVRVDAAEMLLNGSEAQREAAVAHMRAVIAGEAPLDPSKLKLAPADWPEEPPEPPPVRHNKRRPVVLPRLI